MCCCFAVGPIFSFISVWLLRALAAALYLHQQLCCRLPGTASFSGIIVLVTAYLGIVDWHLLRFMLPPKSRLRDSKRLFFIAASVCFIEFQMVLILKSLSEKRNKLLFIYEYCQRDFCRNGLLHIEQRSLDGGQWPRAAPWGNRWPPSSMVMPPAGDALRHLHAHLAHLHR